jgi:hypothetical protein
MSRWVAVLAFAMIACTQPGNHVAARTPSPSSTPTSNPTSSSTPTPIPLPSPTPDLPLATVGFSCRLPVSTPDQRAAFISFPSATISFDSAGNGGLYFDRAFSKWLPVDRSGISPDGTHYAMLASDEQGQPLLHVVEVASRKEQVFKLDNSGPWAGVMDYSTSGIYLTQAFEHILPGIWLFDPRTGSVHIAANIERAEVIAGTALWYGDVNPSDPNPFTTRSSAGILPNEVGRVDLKTGNNTKWLYRPGDAVEVLGVDVSGKPLIRFLAPGSDPGIASLGFFNHSASELLIGLNSTSQQSIYKGEIVETLERPIADSHGVWFGSRQGIYFYSTNGGLQKVSNQPGDPANGCF